MRFTNTSFRFASIFISLHCGHSMNLHNHELNMPCVCAGGCLETSSNTFSSTTAAFNPRSIAFTRVVSGRFVFNNVCGVAMNTQRPKSPEPLHSKGFAYGTEGFVAYKENREKPEELQELFFPEKLKYVREKKAAAERRKEKVRAPWIRAQLKHYGVNFKASDNATVLEGVLKKAIGEGKVGLQSFKLFDPRILTTTKCKTVPSSILALEKELRDKFEPMRRAHRDEVTAWETSEKDRKDREFAALGSPAAEANYDLERFMEKYFVTITAGPPLGLGYTWVPAHHETPGPLAVPGFQSRSLLHAAAERVHGLKTRSGGSGESRTIVIGWDESAVAIVAGKLNAEAIAVAEEAAEAEWQHVMRKHENYVKVRKAVPKTMRIDDLVGSWAVRCAEIEGNWDTSTLTMDVAEKEDPLGVQAAFDFSVLEGTMLLSTTKSALADFKTSLVKDEQSSEEDTDGSDTAESAQKARNGKRKLTPKSHVEPNKKQKADSQSCRVFFCWRGRETGEGEIQLDTNGGNEGHIDVDLASATFKGTFKGGLVGNAPFEGYKLSDEPGNYPEDWSSFSEEAYEYARVRRWH